MKRTVHEAAQCHWTKICMYEHKYWELTYKWETGTISGFWDYGYLFPKFVL